MAFYKFGPNDIFHNQIKTHPEQSFFMYRCAVFLNNEPIVSGANVSNVGNIPTGYANLYELNIDRPSSQLIYPFITKDGSLTTFSTISTSNFNNDFVYGEEIRGSYPLTASISSSYFSEGSPISAEPKREIQALKVALESYSPLSPHYAYSSSLGDKEEQRMRIVYVPSIFYGSSIKKGSISVKIYFTGSLLGELVDDKQNGELRQIFPADANSGSVAGVALYNEGFLVLTGSWDIATAPEFWGLGGPSNCGAERNPQWLDAVQVAPICDSTCISSQMDSASFGLDFKGTQYIPVKTMFAHAAKGELNHSNNPTYIKFGSSSLETDYDSPTLYRQRDDVPIKNIVSGTWADPTASFDKVTYLSKIGIYDKNKSLIAIAKLASPVRKRETDEFTFKLKLDF